jgi:hypothetical protein
MALGLMVLSAGMAFAGVLPSPIQHAASALFSKVGVHVPNGNGANGTGSGKEPGSPSGHQKVTGSGDHGKGTDHGKHTGQQKNGNRGLHKGQAKGGHQGDRGHHGGNGHQGAGQGGTDHHGDGTSGHGSGGPGSGGGGSSHGGGGAGHNVLTQSS